MKRTILIWCLLFAPFVLRAQEERAVRKFPVESVRQAVAVDDDFFYTIDNARIMKYTRDGRFVSLWEESDPAKIRHLNSGVVIGGELYCAHSNYPLAPMASSIEIFDTRTMTHKGNISLGIDVGSCTWIVPGEDCFYVFFAHYDNTGRQPGYDVSWSQLVEYDNRWRRRQAWILPGELIAEIRPNSLSGGVLLDGIFYCTGHDAQKLYLLALPRMGMTLEWIGTLPAPFHGQGIAVDDAGDFWGIDRKTNTVIRARIDPE